MSEPEPITISVKQDGSTWNLYATKIMQTNRAGERLFRGKPYPEIQFSHETEAAALIDANKLQKYLDGYIRKPKKRQDELNWQ